MAIWSYNVADALTAITDTTGTKNTVFLNLVYSRDPNYQLTGENSQAFGYDVDDRLATAGPTSYTYDNADELTQIAVTGGNTTTLLYDATNQLNSYTVMNGSTQVQKFTYTFDAIGNRSKRVDQANNSLNMRYDEASRLTAYGTSATYVYNGDGLRMSKKVNGTSEAYAWDTARGIPLLIVDGTTSYVTGPGGFPLEQVSGRNTYYYHADQLGSIRAVTDSRGGTVNTYSYDAYGNVTSSSGTLANPFTYTGQYLDSESGLYYLRARYYEPSTAQFLTRDPYAPASREAYLYAGDAPTNNSDPGGLWCISFFGFGVGDSCKAKKGGQNPGWPYLDIAQAGASGDINYYARVMEASGNGGTGTFEWYVFHDGAERANCSFQYFGAAGGTFRKDTLPCAEGTWTITGTTFRGGKGSSDNRSINARCPEPRKRINPIPVLPGLPGFPSPRPPGLPIPIPIPIWTWLCA